MKDTVCWDVALCSLANIYIFTNWRTTLL